MVQVSRPSSIKKNKSIIEAAKEEFTKKGFVKASMDNIADQAGVSKGTIYRHFEDKDDLFIKVILNLADSFFDELNVILDKNYTNYLKEAILEYSRLVFEWDIQFKDFFMTALHEFGKNTDRHEVLYEEFHNYIEKHIGFISKILLKWLSTSNHLHSLSTDSVVMHSKIFRIAEHIQSMVMGCSQRIIHIGLSQYEAKRHLVDFLEIYIPGIIPYLSEGESK